LERTPAPGCAARAGAAYRLAGAMARPCIAALITIALLAAVPTAASAAYRDFQSPSGHLACAFFSDGETPRTVRCEWDGAKDRAITLDETGKGKRIKATDTVRSPNGKMLAYGHSMNFGRLRCTSRASGITCRSSRSDHGFTVSVDKQRVF
jgi:hypothetical protein